MASINIDKVVCISLKSHNDSQLEAIGATYNISSEFLIKAKDVGCRKIWLHIGGGVVIAGLDTDNIEDIYFSKEYLPMTAKTRKAILALTPVKTPKMPSYAKNTQVEKVLESIDISELFEVELDVDTILDKINATGIDSLTKRELDFLNESSK
jgi:hypothetical protein